MRNSWRGRKKMQKSLIKNTLYYPKHGHDQVIVLKYKNWQHYPTLKNDQPLIRESKNLVLMTSQVRIYFASHRLNTPYCQGWNNSSIKILLEDRNEASFLSLIWDNVHDTLNYFLITITPLTIYTPIPGERLGSRALTRGRDYTNCKGC